MRGLRPQRKRIFIAIEGDDGDAFVAFLQKKIDELEIPIYLDRCALPGGGYQNMLGIASRERQKRVAKRGSHKAGAFLIVDSDRAQRREDWSLEQLNREAKRFNVICMRPSFEAVLLYMLSGHEPSNLSEAEVKHKLQQHWPGYKKPITEARIFGSKFGIDHVRLLANYPDWLNLLQAMKLI